MGFFFRKPYIPYLSEYMTKEEAFHFQTLEEILTTSSLTPLFQPIVSLKHNKIYGYEALIRGPSNCPLHSPVTLFDTASRNNRLAELDLLCREVAIKEFGRLNIDSKLFLNTSPAALLQPDYPHGKTLKFLEEANLSPENIVIELTEQYPIDDYNLMRDATNHYRDMGFSIAIDDLGAGYSGLRTWSEIKPDFVKLDRHFMADIHNDQQKRHFVQSMVDIAQSINCKVIGEGVEIREEYLTVQDMAIEFSQGYYFGRPTAFPNREIDPKFFQIRSAESKFKQTKQRANTLVSSLLTPLRPLLVSDSINMVGERFQTSTNMIALPVINHQNKVAGIVWRDEFMTLYASRYGRDLHGRKPIHLFMDSDPVIADSSLPLQKLSQLITSNETSHQHSIFIITKDDNYHGVGSLMDLLRKITDLQLTTARHANPLTGLPGNVPISEHIQDALIDETDAVMCYFDLDNFKPYNDYYGFGKGDHVIRATAKILLQHVDANNDFVGHVGGDDFIILFESKNWQERCQQILAAFLTIHAELYNADDLEANGIKAQDRYGSPVFYPLLSLSIGAVRLHDFESLKTEADLTEYASQAKSAAKKQNGNSLYLLASSASSR